MLKISRSKGNTRQKKNRRKLLGPEVFGVLERERNLFRVDRRSLGRGSCEAWAGVPVWRKGEGVEPSGRRLKQQQTGFEDPQGHRTLSPSFIEGSFFREAGGTFF